MESVKQKGRITLHVGTYEIVTRLRRFPRFLPDVLRQLMKPYAHYVASVAHMKY